jgi:hypothetical protein
MGGSESVFAREQIDNGQTLYIPIPHTYYDPLRKWTKMSKKRKREQDDPQLDDFLHFVNNSGRIRAVYLGTASNDLAHGPYGSNDKLLRYFNELDVFKQYWNSKCGSDAIFSKTFLEIMVDMETGQVLTEPDTDYYSMNAKFIQYAVYTASISSVPLMIPLSLTLATGTRGHANTGVLTYGNGAFTCILFEPHAREQSAKSTIRAMETFLRGSMTPNDILHISSPWSDKGLQGNSPICASLSLLMFFTYMVNCQLNNLCDRSRDKSVLTHLWNNRNSIIPIWLYFLDRMIIRSSSMVIKRSVVGLGADKFHLSTEVDAYNCYKKKHCSYPCARNDQGVCYNPLLFYTDKGANMA